MKSVEYKSRRKQLDTVIAIGEGLWNGLVVSGVIAVSAFLIDTFWFF